MLPPNSLQDNGQYSFMFHAVVCNLGVLIKFKHLYILVVILQDVITSFIEKLNKLINLRVE